MINQEYEIRTLAKTLVDLPFGKIRASIEGAERIARLIITEGIDKADACIRVFGRDAVGYALRPAMYINPQAIPDDEIKDYLSPYLPDYVAINIHRETATICLPCAGGKPCPICNAPAVVIYPGLMTGYVMDRLCGLVTDPPVSTPSTKPVAFNL